MYICRECGYLFEEPVKNTERHGFTDGRYEVTSVCPNCGGDFTESKTCECCGRECVPERMIPLIGEDMCSECYEERMRLLSTLNVDDTMPDESDADFWEVWAAEKRSAYRVLPTQRPGPACSVVLESLPEWPMIKQAMEEMEAISATAESEEGICYPTHDPSCKALAEKIWDSYVLRTVLDTGVVAGQFREPVAHALLWYAWNTASTPQVKVVLDSIAKTLDPSVQCPCVATVVGPVYHHNINDYVEDLMAAVSTNDTAVLQIGDHVWNLSTTLVARMIKEVQ